MPYPISPFNEDFNIDILYGSNDDSQNSQVRNSYFQETLKWICSTPNITSIRVNTLKIDVDEFYTCLYKQLSELAIERNRQLPNIQIHPHLKDVIILDNRNKNELNLQLKKKEIVIDVNCGASVLRGAHVFAPGVLGMSSGVQIGDEVSIFVDISKKCKKGMLKTYESQDKLYIGNGIALMNRHNLFNAGNTHVKGIALKIIDTVNGCIQTEDLIPKGIAMLHNIPSIVCVNVLNPQVNEFILDMCAAPGNKTTQIAAHTRNKCHLIAIDKTPNKIKTLKETCKVYGANVSIFQANSTNIFDKTIDAKNVLDGPPFGKEVFDKILLDAPCSALGNRPQFKINVSTKELKSYTPLQRKLFENAVPMLKVNGMLVYSTCTITMSENEGLVAWALKRFKNLKLVKAEPYLGENGLPGTELTEQEASYVQRFGPRNSTDSIGFFIARFTKTTS